MSDSNFFEPVSGAVLPRFAGVPSFMRLPAIDFDHDRINDVDIGIVGVPWDGGTTNRPGARHGPRQLRDLSTMIRAVHPVSMIVTPLARPHSISSPSYMVPRIPI